MLPSAHSIVVYFHPTEVAKNLVLFGQFCVHKFNKLGKGAQFLKRQTIKINSRKIENLCIYIKENNSVHNGTSSYTELISVRLLH